jgi:glutamate synthase (NADPH/NADH) small chain
MEDEGVVFRCNSNVGVNVSISDILREYHAVVLAGGSTVPRTLNIPGKELKGVHFAMQFLKQQNKRNAGKDPFSNASIESNIYSDMLSASGKHVVVIGGGDTGSDCVGTSNRQGAKTVTQFELLPKPPESRTSFMPWPQYPMTLKTSTSHEEGADRKWAVATKEFIGDEKGNLKALKIVDLEWTISQDGRPAQFTERPGSEREIPCDLVFLAMGFVHPQYEGLLQELGVELDERGNVKASEEEYKTNILKIYTCGDMRRGQSLVVWAISEGRECARAVDEFLQGSSMLERKDRNILL